jgi:hypothetical protein
VFRVELRIAEGVNFPYYVMGKGQLLMLPFDDPWVWVDPEADPYVLFAQEYGADGADIGDVEELWYDWLSQVSSSCPDDARDSLQYCGGALLPIARAVLAEYLSRWPEIHAKLTRLLRKGPCESDLSFAIRRNEDRFGLSYPDGGRETIHFSHFPTATTQKPGPHFVFGLGCLERPEELLPVIESELGVTLLFQIREDERVASYRRQIEEITARDHYVQGYGSLVEGLNMVIRTLEKRGAEAALDDIPRKPGEEGLWRIVESLFHHRHLWPKAGLIDFVCASLEELPSPGVDR